MYLAADFIQRDLQKGNKGKDVSKNNVTFFWLLLKSNGVALCYEFNLFIKVKYIKIKYNCTFIQRSLNP